MYVLITYLNPNPGEKTEKKIILVVRYAIYQSKDFLMLRMRHIHFQGVSPRVTTFYYTLKPAVKKLSLFLTSLRPYIDKGFKIGYRLNTD